MPAAVPIAIIAGSAIAGGATIYGASRASKAAKEAATVSARATQAAIDKEWEMYQQSRADYAPWRVAGERALSTMEQLVAAGPGEFKPEETPGYRFGYEELLARPYLQGQAAKGKRLSGETLKGLTERAMSYGETAYDNFLSRYYAKLNPYANLAGMGGTAAGGMAQGALGTGTNIANLTMRGGETQGQNILAQGSAATGMAAGLAGVGQNALSNYTNYMIFKPFMDEMAKKLGVTKITPGVGSGYA